MPDVSVLDVLLYGEQIGTLTLVKGTQTLCTNEVDGHHCSPKSRRLDAGSQKGSQVQLKHPTKPRVTVPRNFFLLIAAELGTSARLARGK
ncbi:hypothetical protein [Bradyrhizobium sp. 179]|uniref:hypothetical protein n=1 Tax=Bradyrhizobium sp. 179 TaxID=2782648 RepID=UPI001FF966CD|nr:hypothetical protein [Bradyrhizobium sp. 179]